MVKEYGNFRTIYFGGSIFVTDHVVIAVRNLLEDVIKENDLNVVQVEEITIGINKEKPLPDIRPGMITVKIIVEE